MDAKLYFLLSVMMFLEFAIWGAWSPVLAARLFGPLKMTGKQTGWIYGTIPLACIISPLIAGQVADRWVNTEWFLAGAHLIGGVLLFVAARKKTFGSLFVVMGLYALAYAPTLGLVPALMFSHMSDPGKQAPNIYIWAPVAWVLVGWFLTGIRRFKGTGDGSDCLIMAGILSLVMGVFCFFLPHTPPPGAAGDVLPFVEAFEMFGNTNFLIFMIVSFVVTAQLQFYFLGTAQFLGDIGIQSKNVPAAMTIAQVAQVLATFFIFGYLLKLGMRPTLAIGAACWLFMYLLYAVEKPRWLVISSQSLHGLAYVFFILGGQIYVNQVASETIRSSAQALLLVVTIGFGFFVGTQFTGVVMDHFKKEDKFQWRPIFLVPCVLTALGAIAIALLFKG
ncbi:MAG: MFS transporter [Sedimentisphaerales bacterium]|nr:MFS transporter [Sedimentisphaerales bacterium]